jgi:UDP-glucose 4-epimerase
LGKKYNIGVIALRYFNAYGPRSFNPENPDNAYSSVLGIFKYRKEVGLQIKVTGNGEQSRDFVHVFDIASANLMAMESNIESDIFNVGTGLTYTINSIAKLFSDDWGYIEPRNGEAEITWANIERIKERLKWSPRVTVQDAVCNHLL